MVNLRVNSKTKINEFKKKHNWLVEKATVKLNVSNIKSLSNDDIESLKCGDVVLKEDASGKHAYLVTFRNDTGICLTYVDASVVETQSYDKSGNNWVYNSEDKFEFVNVENAPSGTIQDVLGLDNLGHLVKGAVSSGTKLYMHTLDTTDSMQQMRFVSTSPTQYDFSTVEGQRNLEIMIMLFGGYCINDAWGAGRIVYLTVNTNSSPISIYFEYYDSEKEQIFYVDDFIVDTYTVTEL